MSNVIKLCLFFLNKPNGIFGNPTDFIKYKKQVGWNENSWKCKTFTENWNLQHFQSLGDNLITV